MLPDWQSSRSRASSAASGRYVSPRCCGFLRLLSSARTSFLPTSTDVRFPPLSALALPLPCRRASAVPRPPQTQTPSK